MGVEYDFLDQVLGIHVLSLLKDLIFFSVSIIQNDHTDTTLVERLDLFFSLFVIYLASHSLESINLPNLNSIIDSYLFLLNPTIILIKKIIFLKHVTLTRFHLSVPITSFSLQL